jgi:hypothetical protein
MVFLMNFSLVYLHVFCVVSLNRFQSFLHVFCLFFNLPEPGIAKKKHHAKITSPDF